MRNICGVLDGVLVRANLCIVCKASSLISGGDIKKQSTAGGTSPPFLFRLLITDLTLATIEVRRFGLYINDCSGLRDSITQFRESAIVYYYSRCVFRALPRTWAC